MAIPVLVLGQSGTGKSYSMKNFDESELCLISVQKPLLPFRKKFEETVVTDKYAEIIKAMQSTKKKVIVIDDTQYLMCNEFMRRATEKGYDKFTQFAVDFQQLLNTIINGTSNDTIVYLLHHTETDDAGHVKAKTIGKMLDQQLTVEGLFSVVLLAKTDGEKYTFITNGFPPAKSPLDMFTEKEIENDLRAVDTAIREYWELKPLGAEKDGAK